MPLDGITSHFLAEELNGALAGGRIEKISQPTAWDLCLRVRKEQGPLTLLLSANPSSPRIHLTEAAYVNPPIPYRFCTLLRKYLSGSRILSVTSPDWERIFLIVFQTVNELGDIGTMTLAAEIMGRYSNIIFIHRSGKILDAILQVDHSTSRVREVLPARPYILPPVQDKFPLEEAAERFRNGGIFRPEAAAPAGKFIVEQVRGFSPLLANEICFIAGIDPAVGILTLDGEQRHRLAASFLSMADVILRGRIRPSLFYTDDVSSVPVDFHALPMTSFRRSVPCVSISGCMDEFYRHRDKIASLEARKSHLTRLAAKKLAAVEKKIQLHRLELSDCKDHDLYRRYGEWIYAGMYLLKGGEKSITVTDYEDPSLPESVVPLDEKLTASQNAQRYFKKYTKLKSRSAAVSGLLENELASAEYFESVLVALSNAESAADIDALQFEFGNVLLLRGDGQESKNPGAGRGSDGDPKASRKVRVPSEPRKFRSSDGIEILIGRNNLQNDALTFRTAAKEDLWMHVQKAPGTHTIVRCGKVPPPDGTIEEAAMLTAWYSRKSEARDTKAVVDYCSVSDVRKQKNSAPGHVLYVRFKTITVVARIPDGVKALNA